MEIFIILITTFVSTLLSAMSGGGASIINLPVFLMLGIPFPTGVSIQKISSAFWVLPAAYNFLKDRKIDWLFLIMFSAIGLIGAYIGVVAAITINQRYLEIAIGILIIFLVIYTYFNRGLGMKEKKRYPFWKKLLSYPFAILMGFYESIFGAGNGIIMTIVTFFTRGFDFIDALGYYFAIAFLWVIFAAILFINKGYYDFRLTVPAVIGSLIGGYVGSKYAKYKGNKFIKLMFLLVGGILGIKLIFGL